MKLETAIQREFDVSEKDAQSVADAATRLLTWWNAQRIRVTSYMQPNGADRLDAKILETIQDLAKSKVKGSLGMLAFAVEQLLKAEIRGSWESTENVKPLALLYRLSVDAFALAQMRDLKARETSGDWTVEAKGPDGATVTFVRTFPLWGYERLRAISSKEAAQAHYRDLLKSRGII